MDISSSCSNLGLNSMLFSVQRIQQRIQNLAFANFHKSYNQIVTNKQKKIEAERLWKSPEKSWGWEEAGVNIVSDSNLNTIIYGNTGCGVFKRGVQN